MARAEPVRIGPLIPRAAARRPQRSGSWSPAAAHLFGASTTLNRAFLHMTRPIAAHGPELAAGKGRIYTRANRASNQVFRRA